MEAPTRHALPARSVIGFTLCLPDFDEVLRAECPATHVETRLMACLERPVRLLRWAVVRMEQREGGSSFWCEGAYLKESDTGSRLKAV